MADADRADIVRLADTVVVKVGTNVLADPAGALDRRRIQALADQLHRGCGPAAGGWPWSAPGPSGPGVGRLGLGKRPTDLRAPPGLRRRRPVGPHAAVPGVPGPARRPRRPDPADRRRLRQPRPLPERPQHHPAPCSSTAACRSSTRTTPCRVAEIKFGDNDHLAAMVTNLLQAPLLVLLTNVDGLFTGRPAARPGRPAGADGPAHRPVGDGHGRRRRTSALGTGGMRSKLRAARLATAAGEAVVMANGVGRRRARRRLRGGAGRHAVPAAPGGAAGPAAVAGLTARPRAARGGRRGPAGGRAGRAGACCRSGWWRWPGRSARATWCRCAGADGGRVRPRADQLLARRRRAHPRPVAPTRSPRCWARCRTWRSSTATTWPSSPEPGGGAWSSACGR